MSEMSLKELSDRATPGEWHVDWLPAWNEDNGASEPDICDGICIHTPEHEAESVLCCSEREAAFIVAIVNAYRNGELCRASDAEHYMRLANERRDALADAVARARREALEEAASKAEGQLAYWRDRMRAEKCLEDGISEDGQAYTPIGDVAAWQGGYCNGRMGEAEWWISTLRALAANPPETRQTETGWRPTGSVCSGVGCPEVEWFRPSDGIRRMHPVGFNPNTGRYEGLVINSPSPAPPAIGNLVEEGRSDG